MEIRSRKIFTSSSDSSSFTSSSDSSFMLYKDWPSFTVEMWLNPPENFSKKVLLIGKIGVFALWLENDQNDDSTRLTLKHVNFTSLVSSQYFTLPKNEWTHLGVGVRKITNENDHQCSHNSIKAVYFVNGQELLSSSSVQQQENGGAVFNPYISSSTLAEYSKYDTKLQHGYHLGGIRLLSQLHQGDQSFYPDHDTFLSLHDFNIKEIRIHDIALPGSSLGFYTNHEKFLQKCGLHHDTKPMSSSLSHETCRFPMPLLSFTNTWQGDSTPPPDLCKKPGFEYFNFQCIPICSSGKRGYDFTQGKASGCSCISGQAQVWTSLSALRIIGDGLIVSWQLYSENIQILEQNTYDIISVYRHYHPRPFPYSSQLRGARCSIWHERILYFRDQIDSSDIDL